MLFEQVVSIDEAGAHLVEDQRAGVRLGPVVVERTTEELGFCRSLIQQVNADCDVASSMGVLPVECDFELGPQIGQLGGRQLLLAGEVVGERCLR